jgi:thioredoxin-like negative regulator of GroEL
MSYRKVSWISFLSVVFTVIPGWADTSAEIYSRGQKLLREGKLEAAAKEFDQAAAAEPKNEEYAAKAKQLSKVFALQEVLAKEKDDGSWTRVARALHLFYRSEKLNDEALKLDRQIHSRLNSALSAGILADTLLALGKNDEAAELIEKLPEKQHSLDTDAVRAIALARAGKQKEAIDAVDAIKLPDEICAGKSYLLARVNGAVGRNEEAAKYLKKSFESTPPEKLPNFLNAAKSSPDFAKLLADDRYATLWTTTSKPSEQEHEHKHSHNDGRSHCLGCPSLDQVQDIPDGSKVGSDGDAAKPAVEKKD